MFGWFKKKEEKPKVWVHISTVAGKDVWVVTFRTTDCIQTIVEAVPRKYTKFTDCGIEWTEGCSNDELKTIVEDRLKELNNNEESSCNNC